MFSKLLTRIYSSGWNKKETIFSRQQWKAVLLTASQATSNCIDCHMPERETNLIVFDWKGHKQRPQVRTHWIKTYSDATTLSGVGEK